MSLIGLVIEGGLIIAGGAAGHFEGYLMGSKVRNVTQLFLQPGKTPETVWCTCGHAMSFHANRDGACSDYLTDNKGRMLRSPSGTVDLRCRCQHFVADPAQVEARPRGELEL